MSLLSVMAYRLDISLVFQPPMSMMVDSGTPISGDQRHANFARRPHPRAEELGERGIIASATLVLDDLRFLGWKG